jgi:arylsulfatase A-like enzyme
MASDHGEGFGEHQLYDHGESLYRTETHVALLLLLPGRGQAGRIVRDTVSLRDLPATIVDQVGLAHSAPFPGQSLARFWGVPSTETGAAPEPGAISELASPNLASPNHGRSPATRGPLVALADGDFVFIRNMRDGTEELFDERDDPYELQNRARAPALRPLLARYRARLLASPQRAHDAR